MKKYRVSGFMDEVGAVQVDIEATSGAEAMKIAEEEYDLYEVVNVSEAKRTVCPDCGDRGWLYDDEGRRTGTCPCHY